MFFCPILTHISNTNKIVKTEMNPVMNDCPVCLEPTCNTLDRTCSHPLCIPCIGQLKDYSSILSDTGIRIFPCPLCRVKSRPSYEDLEERCRVLSANPPRQLNLTPDPRLIARFNEIQRTNNLNEMRRILNTPSPVPPLRIVRPVAPRQREVCEGGCSRRTTRRCPATLNSRCENNVCRECYHCRACIRFATALGR